MKKDETAPHFLYSAYPTCSTVFAIQNFPKRILLEHSKYSLQFTKMI